MQKEQPLAAKRKSGQWFIGLLLFNFCVRSSWSAENYLLLSTSALFAGCKKHKQLFGWEKNDMDRTIFHNIRRASCIYPVDTKHAWMCSPTLRQEAISQVSVLLAVILCCRHCRFLGALLVLSVILPILLLAIHVAPNPH